MGKEGQEVKKKRSSTEGIKILQENYRNYTQYDTIITYF